MNLTVDSKQRITTFLLMCLEFYKVVMGTFLIVFVPQDCNGTICTATENFFKEGRLYFGGNVCNFITFSAIGTLYFIELKRENWCIQYLDIDDEKSTNNLDTEIEAYPKYKKEMNRLNKNYVNATYFAVLMMCINFIVSGFTVYQTYTGSNSITSFVSFFLLVSMKLYNAWTVGRLSIKDERANSAYMKEPKTYNTIDENYRILEDDKDISTSVTVEMGEKHSDDEVF
jgi:hypothetical protein